MSDPTILAWDVSVIGLTAVAVGLILALHGNDQRNPSRVAGCGKVLAWVGGVITVAPALVLCIQMGWYGGVALVRIVQAQGESDAYRK